MQPPPASHELVCTSAKREPHKIAKKQGACCAVMDTAHCCLDVASYFWGGSLLMLQCSPHACAGLCTCPSQVPDCAEVCQHYLEDCSMDWPVALTLVHLQHKHQQEQHQQRQQQWQQQQQPSANLPRTTSGTSIASARRPGQRTSLHSRSSMSSSLLRGLGGSGANGLDAVAPPLPVPSESVYLQVGWSSFTAVQCLASATRRLVQPCIAYATPCTGLRARTA